MREVNGDSHWTGGGAWPLSSPCAPTPRRPTPTLLDPTVFHQLLSLSGAGCILWAYVANQRGLLGPERPLYSLLNLVGSLLLLWVAIVDVRWGFIVLEAVWAAVSIPPLLRPRTPAAS